jgi:antitoxin FitA
LKHHPETISNILEYFDIILLSQPFHLPDCLRHAIADANALLPQTTMANLIVCNVDETISNALKVPASQHGISAESEHRQILAQALLCPQKKSFYDALRQIPDVGTDADFARFQDL